MHKRYLVLVDNKAWYADWLDNQNHYVEGMTVIDLHYHQFTIGGLNGMI